MKSINTKYHGVRQYEDSDVITFQKGIPGFPELKKFIIFPVEENEVFKIMQSIEDKDIGLTLISPFLVKKDYEFKLEDNTIKNLEVQKPEDVLVFTTVTISSKVEDITTNLIAPIIINIKGKIGEQIILNSEKYSVKYPLFKEEV
ncbi:flagellar assembly protein FliW [Haloimpatiens sp. FM7330]|uniref:flagellar assembly protein FliW n=1 Tax=Haloimpatiens sp. FM7330 TaxID=3298610 RepID=UPI00363F0D59